MTGYTGSFIVAVMANNNGGSGNGGGSLLHRWRKKQDLTMEALAERLRCTRNYVGMLEGGVATPGLKMAVRIKRVTKIPPEAWVAEEVEREAVASAP